LRRPVYGLRQAPREWHDTLMTTLAALGFVPSTADLSLFQRIDTSLPPFYVLVYGVDAVKPAAPVARETVAPVSREPIAPVARESVAPAAHLAAEPVTPIAHVPVAPFARVPFLQLPVFQQLQLPLITSSPLMITRDRARRTITLTQSHMVHLVLQRFGFWYSSTQSTPLPTGHSLSAPPSEPNGLYLELLGCLMYLMTCTRPDLAYPLSILARYVAPGRHQLEHREAAKC
ncbi:unnamed protein product, partial [Closterium sp. NIES-53]